MYDMKVTKNFTDESYEITFEGLYTVLIYSNKIGEIFLRCEDLKKGSVKNVSSLDELAESVRFFRIFSVYQILEECIETYLLTKVFKDIDEKGYPPFLTEEYPGKIAGNTKKK